MDFFKRLFGKKEKTKVIEQVTDSVEENIEEPAKRPYIEEECGICKQPIGTARWKKAQGHFMHKNCAKKLQKDILNGR